MGRFLSEDPVFGDLANPSSLHAFGYGNGNPLGFTDPTGEMGVKPINEADSTRQMDYWMGVYRSAPEGSAQRADALQKYQFWKNEAQDARENIIFNEEVTFPAARDALAALVVGPAAKAYRVVRWGLGLMSVSSGVSRLNQASQQQGTQRTGNLIAGTAEVVAGGLMFTPEVVEAAPKVVDAAKAMQQKATKFLDEFSVVPEGEVAGPGGVRMPVPDAAPAAPSAFEARALPGASPAGGASRVWPKHHPFPQYLGGVADQTLKKIPKKLHHRFHAALDKWKGGRYARSKGAEHFRGIDRETVIGDLREFYGEAEGGLFKKYLSDFEQAVGESLE